ncbi:hypothetical protein [Helicobacter sp. T3_23-1056]
MITPQNGGGTKGKMLCKVWGIFIVIASKTQDLRGNLQTKKHCLTERSEVSQNSNNVNRDISRSRAQYDKEMFVITSKAFALRGNPTFSSLRAQLVVRGNLLFLSLKEIAFLSLRDSRLLLKRLESWQSIITKCQKRAFSKFNQIDCHEFT